MKDAMVGENFQIADIREKLLSVKVALTDIEGTTTSIPFVRNVLKSYCKENLNKYIRENWDNAELLDIRREMEMESVGSSEDTSVTCTAAENFDSSSISKKDKTEEYILRNIESKQAPHAVKFLQTKIWEEGYACSALKGHLFPDVIPALQKWNELGLRIYMYSSGIQLAQKLLFTHSSEGDVHELISGFFDLDIGPKVDADSYKKIMEEVDCLPENAVFLTDNVQEADAAQNAGMVAVLVLREGNEPLDPKYCKLFPAIHSFEEITSLFAKRKLSSPDESDKDIFTKKAKLNSEVVTSVDSK